MLKKTARNRRQHCLMIKCLMLHKEIASMPQCVGTELDNCSVSEEKPDVTQDRKNEEHSFGQRIQLSLPLLMLLGKIQGRGFSALLVDGRTSRRVMGKKMKLSVINPQDPLDTCGPYSLSRTHIFQERRGIFWHILYPV